MMPARIVHGLFQASVVFPVPIRAAHSIEAAVPEERPRVAGGDCFVDESFALSNGLVTVDKGGVLIPKLDAGRGQHELSGKADGKQRETDCANDQELEVHAAGGKIVTEYRIANGC